MIRVASAFSWQGCIGRLQFAVYLLHQVFWVGVIVLAGVYVKAEPGTLTYSALEWLLRIAFLGWLIGTWPLWCAAIKRFHDIDMRGWWSLSLLVAAPLVLLFLLLVPGMKEGNRFKRPHDEDNQPLTRFRALADGRHHHRSPLADLLRALVEELFRSRNYGQAFIGSTEWENRLVTAAISSWPVVKDAPWRRALGQNLTIECAGILSDRHSGEVDGMDYDNTISRPFTATLCVGPNAALLPAQAVYLLFEGAVSHGRIIWTGTRDPFGVAPFEIPASVASAVKEGDGVSFYVVMAQEWLP